jgi:hypothetical protein
LDTIEQCNGSGSAVDYTYRETRHKTLEEIAAAFGDRVVEVGDRDVEADGSEMEEKADTRHVETKTTV